MNTITLHHKTINLPVSFENKILDFVHDNRALDSAVTSNQIAYKLCIMGENTNRNHGVHF